MTMLRLKPLPEEKAPENIRHIYAAIKDSFQIPSVPLFFQYIGNYPEYLAYVWSVLSPNIQTEGFHNCCDQIVQISQSAISVIYTPSEPARTLSSQMNTSEKEHLSQTIAELRLLNVRMMILTIAIRESLKGLSIVTKQLSEGSYLQPAEQATEAAISDMVFESMQAIPSSEISAVDPKVANMLVPIYGANALMISHYPAFFALCADELENLMKTEAYLKARVEMEKITHLLLSQLTHPIQLSYIETEKMLFNKPHAGDLLFVMKDTFPANFPKLVLATEMMEKMLSGSSERATGIEPATSSLES